MMVTPTAASTSTSSTPVAAVSRLLASVTSTGMEYRVTGGLRVRLSSSRVQS